MGVSQVPVPPIESRAPRMGSVFCPYMPFPGRMVPVRKPCWLEPQMRRSASALDLASLGGQRGKREGVCEVVESLQLISIMWTYNWRRTGRVDEEGRQSRPR